MVLDAAPTGMIMVDDRGAIVLVNRHVELLFGYERAELLEMQFGDMVYGAALRHPAESGEDEHDPVDFPEAPAPAAAEEKPAEPTATTPAEPAGSAAAPEAAPAEESKPEAQA